MPAADSFLLMLYAPGDVVMFLSPVTFVHVPLTFFWSWIVARAIGVPPVVALSVPLIVKFWLTGTEVRLAAAESCVGALTWTCTTGLVALA